MARRYLPGLQDDQPAWIKAVSASLAALSTRLDTIEGTVKGHDADLTALARGVATLTGTVPTPRQDPSDTDEDDQVEGRRDWLTVNDPDQATTWLTDAAEWLRDIGAHHRLAPGPCWPLHPEVVAEVLALVDTRGAAYAGGPADVAEWLTRWLPGARDRIRSALGDCRDGHQIGAVPHAVSALDLGAVARWWATDRATRPDIPLRAYLRPLETR